MTKIHLKINTGVNNAHVDIFHTITSDEDWVLDVDLLTLKEVFFAELKDDVTQKDMEWVQKTGDFRFIYVSEAFDPDVYP